jgi:hypothetical protein
VIERIMRRWLVPPSLALSGLAGLLGLIVVLGTACNRGVSQPVSAEPGGATSTDKSAPAQVKPLTFHYASGLKPGVGSEVDAVAEGLRPGLRADVIWETVTGGWIVEKYYRFLGKKFSESTTTLGHAEVGPDGRLAFHFAVPEDYGGVHNVTVTADGVLVAQGGIEVQPTFEISPKEGPIGAPIEVRVKGLGWRTMESTYVVSWDNAEAGWVSAVSTRGSAIARLRASGSVGEHQVKLYTGYTGHAYLNHEQAPNAYLPRPQFTFRVTPGVKPASAYAEPYAPQPVPLSKSAGTARVIAALAPTQGPVQTRVVLTASGLPAQSPVTLVWDTQAGSRVTDAGFGATQVELSKAIVGGDGRLDVPLTIPDDLGGLHALLIRSGEQTLATAHFTIETSIVSMTPAAGPAGSAVSIHLKGVGWTDYDNIYVATYDNAYMGYACGFNSQGDVVINFTAAGSPGVHLIDLYPGIYQGPENSQQVYRLPQLTYADDHPGNKIPALRFAFTVTPSAQSSARSVTGTR